ncbi:hypothetical protein E6C60_4101 [Paenibacillus algicola]|uniref:Uncharacterized protein n=1 Tax=Paenibacillus algicola TaxID=2565926 RepID=A0A4P8XPL6_9BACL|nr:hypothetical protein E6C60_4101 [Paenibacillus algicola]
MLDEVRLRWKPCAPDRSSDPGNAGVEKSIRIVQAIRVFSNGFFCIFQRVDLLHEYPAQKGT